MSAIKPPEPLDATEGERAIARANCAERARARGEDPLALSYEMGEQDGGWAMKFEVSKLRAEGVADANR